METKFAWTKRIATLATVAAVVYGLPTVGWAATGGMIRFTGAIVAPQFDISFTSAAGVPATRGMAASASRDGSTANVTFRPEPGNASSADVELDVVGSAMPGSNGHGNTVVSALFTDSRGRAYKKSPEGDYRVRRDGGVLALTETRSQGLHANDAVLVVINYD